MDRICKSVNGKLREMSVIRRTLFKVGYNYKLQQVSQGAYSWWLKFSLKQKPLLKNMSRKEVETALGKWFINATDRDGNRALRAQRDLERRTHNRILAILALCERNRTGQREYGLDSRCTFRQCSRRNCKLLCERDISRLTPANTHGACVEPMDKILWAPLGLPMQGPSDSPSKTHMGPTWTCWLGCGQAL
ncbi:Long-chain-fatty-acid--CoA ligase 4 [Anabarilius grahami]|uniref:Long-chain-fatty-acid--CoA ligase 4 n=1 Tax=Anabarilius grahami TaxID=495550 RepID=A0A3N0ZAL2_ANAGA|nr:Long-chain-fatty-acid--CoA ligase 4 [Anabarilius grahami]